MKQPINALTYDELKNLYEHNNYLRNIAFELVQEENQYFIDNEIISYFCNVWNEARQRREWYADIEEYYPGCFSVSVKQHNYKSFLECCREFNNTGIGFCNPELTALIDRLSARADLFDSCLSGYADISDKNALQLEAWIDKGIAKISEALRQILQTEHDQIYDDDYIIYNYFEYPGNAENLEADIDTFIIYENIPARIVEHKQQEERQ